MRRAWQPMMEREWKRIDEYFCVEKSLYSKKKSLIYRLPSGKTVCERGIAFYFGLLISDEKISVSFLIAILILLAVCKCFS